MIVCCFSTGKNYLVEVVTVYRFKAYKQSAKKYAHLEDLVLTTPRNMRSNRIDNLVISTVIYGAPYPLEDTHIVSSSLEVKPYTSVISRIELCKFHSLRERVFGFPGETRMGEISNTENLSVGHVRGGRHKGTTLSLPEARLH